jgi:hypothetical protein
VTLPEPDPAAYRRTLAAARRRVAVLLARSAAVFPGGIPGPGATPAQWAGFTSKAAEIAAAAGDLDAMISLRWLALHALRAGHLPEHRMYLFASLDAYTEAARLARLGREELAREQHRALDGMEHTTPGTSCLRRMLRAAQAAAEAQGRSVVAAAFLSQDCFRGYTRLTSPGACALCRAAAARGPRHADRPWPYPHPNCHCGAAPVTAPPPAIRPSRRQVAAHWDMVQDLTASARAALR